MSQDVTRLAGAQGNHPMNPILTMPAGTRLIFTDAASGPILREHRQVWVLIDGMGTDKVRVHREGEPEGLYATMPAEWLEPVAVTQCPIPFPGDDLAERLPDGGWRVLDDTSPYHKGLPRLPEYDEGRPVCQGFRPHFCTDHLPGWHVAAGNERVFEVWPVAAEDGAR